ncbi:MAG: glutamine--fructose-6-phosphate transaminase (isomerizing) [Candidatus Aenigmarchaeota archaeon]|nr:glutamine--fructose-6-phosphate transaminase (isomerizing) [Candidatus Aenigmarchaeota archaeon]
MCGIIGYIGRREAFSILISGLQRMEYRGYDSYGFCVLDRNANPHLFRRVGKVSDLDKSLPVGTHSGNLGIAHTRWATHGEVTEKNAHPHTDCKNNVFVVHNGIIENYKYLKDGLVQEGHKFSSDTDTEVVAHLIEKFFSGNLEIAVRKALNCIKGTYGLAAICRQDPGKIVAARCGSPLLIGIGEKELLVASDPAAVIAHTRKVIYLNEGEMSILTPESHFIFTERPFREIEWKLADVERGVHPHYLLKEILEQPESIKNCLRGRLMPEEGRAQLGGLKNFEERLKEIERIYVVACGTARHAGLIAELMFEEYAGITTKVDVSSEFRYRKSTIDRKSAMLAISQSGETADTLAAIRDAKAKGILTLGITNVIDSTQARETDAGLYTHAGPEISVASTKAFTTQLAVLSLMTLYLGRQRGLSREDGRKITLELEKIPQLVQQTINNCSSMRVLAEKYKGFENYLYLGRKYSYPVAREGAHKIKETAYVHAEGCRGGEPKHCELALVSEKFPCVCVVPSDSVYRKMISNMEEVKARKGRILAIATEGNNEIKTIADDVLYIPKTIEMLTPILSTIPLQLFSYYAGVARGCEIDKPKNLAKSVTVE